MFMNDLIVENPTPADLTSENPRFHEQRIQLAEKTLVIPAYVQEKMDEMSCLVRDLDTVAEIAGFGYTRETGDNVEVVDFIMPDKERIYNLNNLFINQDQSKLASILAKAVPTQLRIIDGIPAIVPEGADRGGWMEFDVKDGKINWGYASKEISKLLGFDQLPNDVGELQSIIESQRQEEEKERKDYLEVPSDWDAVIAGGSVTITHQFIDRVRAHAEEVGADLNFSMHHHPALGLLGMALADKPVAERRKAYEVLLKYSPADVKTMHDLGIEFFEIRAFGTIDKPMQNQAGHTSAFYQTSTILQENPQVSSQ